MTDAFCGGCNRLRVTAAGGWLRKKKYIYIYTQESLGIIVGELSMIYMIYGDSLKAMSFKSCLQKWLVKVWTQMLRCFLEPGVANPPVDGNQKSGGSKTSWFMWIYGKYPIIYISFIHVRWFSRRIYLQNQMSHLPPGELRNCLFGEEGPISERKWSLVAICMYANDVKWYKRSFNIRYIYI